MSFEMKAGDDFDPADYPQYSNCNTNWYSPLAVPVPGTYGGFGLWDIELMKSETNMNVWSWTMTTKVTKECKPWSTIQGCYDLDAPLKFGRAVSLIVAVSACLIFVMSLVASCVVLPKMLWRIAGGIEIALGFVAPLVFVGIATEICKESGVECTPDTAVFMTIPAFLFFVVAGVSMMFMKERRLAEVDADMPSQKDSPSPPPVAPVEVYAATDVPSQKDSPFHHNDAGPEYKDQMRMAPVEVEAMAMEY